MVERPPVGWRLMPGAVESPRRVSRTAAMAAQVFLTGGSARSEFIVQKLHQELMIECKVLNPTTFLQMELPPQQAGEIEQVAPQLAVALGAALGAL